MKKLSNFLLVSVAILFFKCTSPDETILVISKDATSLEHLAARKYQCENRILVFTDPSALQKTDNFQIKVLLFPNTIEIRGKLIWRHLGESSYNEIPLTHMSRNVFEMKVPVSTFDVDFEYHLEVIACEKELNYPVTA